MYTQMVLRLFFLLLLPTGLYAQWDSLPVPGRAGTQAVFNLDSGVYTHSYSDGWYRSRDAGSTWEQLHIPGTSPFSAANWKNAAACGDHLYIIYDTPTADAVLFRSIDGGQQWQAVPGSANLPDGYLTAYQGGVLFLGTGGAWRLPEGSDTWLPLPVGGDINWNAAAQGAEIWLAGAYSNDSIYRSTDAGLNWQLVPGVKKGLNILLHGDTVLVNTTDGLFYSGDHGQNWQQIPGDYLTAKFYADSAAFYQVNPNQYELWATTDLFATRKRLWKADEFSSSPAGIVRRGNVLILPTIGSGVYLSADNGDTWSLSGMGMKSIQPYYAMLNGGDSILLIQSGNPFKTMWSNDAGASWHDNARAPVLWDVVKRNDWYYGVGPGIYRTQNVPGGDWEQVSGGLLERYRAQLIDSTILFYKSETGGNEGYRTLFETIVPPPGGCTFWDLDYRGLALANKQLYTLDLKTHQILRTADWGCTWTPVAQMGNTFNVQFRNGGYRDGKIYLADASSLLISGDDGATWTIRNLALPEFGNFCPELMVVPAGLLIKSNSGQLYFSPDDAVNWIEIGPKSPLITGYYRAIEVQGNDLYVLSTDAAERHVLWRRPHFAQDIKFASGTVYFDSNNNGVRDTGELPAPNIIVSLKQSGRALSTDSSGHFFCFFDTKDTLTIASLPSFCSNNPPYYIVNSADSLLQIGISCPPDQSDIQVDLTEIAPFRPGFITPLVLTVKNAGMKPAQGRAGLRFDSGRLNIQQAVPSPAAANDSTIQWAFGPLGPFESRSFKVFLQTGSNTPLGFPLVFTGLADSINFSDPDTANNRVVLTAVVTGSFDPNDKSVNPAVYDTGDLQAGQSLTYTIRFQNTGTFYAERVVLRDTLSANLETGSLQVIAASHPCSWQLRDPNQVEFRFEQIFLPPEQNDESGSHGFVKFRVRPRPTLQVDDTISNRASIYFDFNQAIITNTVATILQKSVVGAFEAPPAPLSLRLWPNPAAEQVWVELPDSCPPGAWISVADAKGQICLYQKPSGPRTLLRLQDLAAGTYLVFYYSGKQLLYEKLFKI